MLDRTLITLKDTCDEQGDLFGQSLNLICKEQLPEEDVQCYKSWLIEHLKENTFETLVAWVELRVHIIEETREETRGLETRKERNGDQRMIQRRERGFNAMSNLKAISSVLYRQARTTFLPGLVMPLKGCWYLIESY